MKATSRHLLAPLFVALLLQGHAQEDPVQDAIRKFENSRNKKPAEVKVVLDPPAEVTAPEPESQPAGEPPEEPSGKTEPTEPAKAVDPAADGDPKPAEAPQGLQTPVPPKTPEVPDAPPVAEPATNPDPPAGVSVSVSKLETGGTPLDTSTLKVLAPFPAKPLSRAPNGWLIEPSDNIPPYNQKVELEPGKTITLSVKPHVMVPDADGIRTFMVPEPGYNPALEYQQNATIGAVLAGSLRQLDTDSKQLGAALDQLEQLLISLPKPKARPVPEP